MVLAMHGEPETVGEPSGGGESVDLECESQTCSVELYEYEQPKIGVVRAKNFGISGSLLARVLAATLEPPFPNPGYRPELSAHST